MIVSKLHLIISILLLIYSTLSETSVPKIILLYVIISLSFLK